MVLFSSTYFIFLVAIFFLYWPVARFRALALAVILFANYFFYAKWDIFYLGLIPIASTCDFVLALLMEKSKKPALRRLLVTFSIVLNLGILAAFKYMPLVKSDWSWVFPLGISFYAFQSLSYTIDVYRRDAKATSSYLAYLAAVSFFPTILSGPITRVTSLLPQLERKQKQLLPADGGRALFLIGLGLLKKLLIADYLGDNFVNRVFDLPKLYSGFENLVAVYGYAFQLYYDFSGYSDIAIGSALLLGMELPRNFNKPYAAENIADFWRRWHISLSNWLRDYLYFSLPGLRSKNKVWTYLNLVITMVLGGLWHGANWNYALWGLLHGSGLAASRAAQVLRGDARPSTNQWARYARVFVTFHFVCFAWIFFRAANFSTAVSILERIASLTYSTANISAPFCLVLYIAVMAHFVPKKIYDWSMDAYAASPFYVQAAALALLIIGVENVAATGSAPFIYTKF